MNLDALVAPLRADVVSGASVVARTAAEVVRRAAVRIPADDVPGLRSGLGELAVKILDAQPAMAPLVALGREVLEAVEGAGSVEEGRRAAVEAAGSFHEAVEERTAAVGRRAAELIPVAGTLLTLSSSSTVRAALLGHPGAGDLRVICLEGRPAQEGLQLAGALARAGIDVTVAVDAAAGSLLPDVDLVLLGADSVGDRGIVNKIGSRLMAFEARRLGIPVVVTADRTKLLPPGFPQPTDDDRPGDEVWRAPVGVQSWNRYFESVPLNAVSTLITDLETLDADEVDSLRRSFSVPPELQSWADRRQASG